MINTDRIVPVTKTDLLTLYSVMLAMTSTAATKLSDGIPGEFTVSEAGTYIADQPVKTLNFTAASGTVYFVAAQDFAGITVNGAAVELETEPEADGATLYTAVLASGDVTVTQIGL